MLSLLTDSPTRTSCAVPLTTERNITHLLESIMRCCPLPLRTTLPSDAVDRGVPKYTQRFACHSLPNPRMSSSVDHTNIRLRSGVCYFSWFRRDLAVDSGLCPLPFGDQPQRVGCSQDHSTAHASDGMPQWTQGCARCHSATSRSAHAPSSFGSSVRTAAAGMDNAVGRAPSPIR
jgi:hypothetical protein